MVLGNAPATAALNMTALVYGGARGHRPQGSNHPVVMDNISIQ